MIGILQTTPTNCLEACVAGIFEIKLSEVPTLPNDDGWMPALNQWLARRNLYTFNIKLQDKAIAPDILRGYSIGCIASPNIDGALHAVICLDGMIVYDPLTGTTSGTEMPESWDIFCVLDPARQRVQGW